MNLKIFTNYEVERPGQDIAHDVDDVIDRFKNHLVLQGKSKDSNYPRIARQFCEYVIESDSKIEEETLALYIHDKRASVQSAVRSFFKFAFRNNIRKLAKYKRESQYGVAENELILSFITHCPTLTNDLSRKTYLGALNEYFRHIAENGLALNFLSANSFIEYLKQKPGLKSSSRLSPFTINTYRSAIRTFSSWLIENRDFLKLDLNVEQVESIRQLKSLKNESIEKKFYKEGLTETQRNLLIDSITDPKLKAVTALMAYSGLREVEITRLEVKDISIGELTISIQRKGKSTKKKARLFQSIIPYIQTYIELEKPVNQLFPGITTDYIYRNIVQKLKELGLKKETVSVHSLRHTAAQIMIKKGVPTDQVQHQLGHTTSETTQWYVKQNWEEEMLRNTPTDI